MNTERSFEGSAEVQHHLDPYTDRYTESIDNTKYGEIKEQIYNDEGGFEDTGRSGMPIKPKVKNT